MNMEMKRNKGKVKVLDMYCRSIIESLWIQDI